MWKYIVLDQDNKIQSDIFETDIEYSASVIASCLEKQGFEVLYLSKITPLELGAYLIKAPLLERRKTYAGL